MDHFKTLFDRYNAIVFFDTETTGLDAKTCRITELAAIRIESDAMGDLYEAGRMDEYIRLPEGMHVPEKITEITGITDEILESQGIPESEAASRFTELLGDGPVLLCAHNAQFDLQFAGEFFNRHGFSALRDCDYLDTMTVFKDRRRFPHRLENAVEVYHLGDKVANTHRASDDVEALYEVCKAMDRERPDLADYVNVFGYNPKYGINGEPVGKVTYHPQKFSNKMQPPENILPAQARLTPLEDALQAMEQEVLKR